ncbi:MAG: HAMP domain-containing protein, partial [Candidatus Tectomicrobia bacterium]|nr:HAMP domain-containing protein [Candidatus Tectomicrobia bacterium]
LVVSRTGHLIAHGRNEAKAGILQPESLMGLPIVQSVLRGEATPQVYRNPQGIEILGVGASIQPLGWGVIIEQPTAEAYAAPRRMTSRLVGLAALSLLLMMIVGSWGGQRQIVWPIRTLIQGAQRVGSGDLDQRVEISTRDELEQLGEAFNQMMERLRELQADIRRNERMVTFGRIAAGLVHDLRIPLRNLENNSKLLLQMFDDPEYRQTFQGIARREFANLNRFLDDLHNLTRPSSLCLIQLDLNQLVREVLALYQEEAQEGGVRLIAFYHPEGLRVQADRFALERALKNLITNAFQAMPGGGELRVSIRAAVATGIGSQGSGDRKPEDPHERIPENSSWAEVSIQDTGCGIPPERLRDLFVEYVTTKRKGLGLGLAITRKILEEHGGSIQVESQPGEGTCFRLYLPRNDPKLPAPI